MLGQPLVLVSEHHPGIQADLQGLVEVDNSQADLDNLQVDLRAGLADLDIQVVVVVDHQVVVDNFPFYHQKVVALYFDHQGVVEIDSDLPLMWVAA